MPRAQLLVDAAKRWRSPAPNDRQDRWAA